jgi:TolA-binding protein
MSMTSCRSSRSSRTNQQRNNRTQQPAPTAAETAQGTSAKAVLDHADSALQRVGQLSTDDRSSADREALPMAETPMRMPPNFMPPRRLWGEPYVPQPNLTEYGLYEAALGAYNGRRYDESIALLSQVVTTGRPPELVPNAYYWMGESFYAEQRYAESMPYFEYVTRVGPQYKREISLYKLSRAELHLGNKQGANMYYERLRNEYPRSRYIATLRKLGAR